MSIEIGQAAADENRGASAQTRTLYYGLNLITDRTMSDVQRAEYLSGKNWDDMTEAEREEWSGDLKGAYNAGDLNRVESAVAYLAQVLRDLPNELAEHAKSKGVGWDVFFDVPYDKNGINPITKVDWNVSDVQTPTDMERYLSNVVLLRNALEYVTDELPESMDNLTWQEANAIEKALKALDETIIVFRDNKKTLMNNAAASWFYSGEIFYGEV